MIESLVLLAYVGPGAGLSMLGALFAVVTVLVLAVLAPLLYPIRWVWRRFINAKPVDQLK